ncbi:hypothetical protein GA0115239_100276 [Streptomyces sp. BpilaLS-43]|uniref:hypothetical protein n=1 Tax=Streptomyces sp. BpilaLS-43 TaxID=1839778 RepID=UPI00081BA4E2|nr:hypothetical protein [Streptomyces sp. BpilaLS-43]SCD28199.1 hypothetical protein GA0115239_100276 [Streptomyces sp. BpilaLS-43]
MGTEKATDGYEGLYAHTPSQAEGERDDAPERGRATETHPDTPRTQPSQAEGDRSE